MLAEDMRLLGQRQGLSYAYQSQQHRFNVFISFSLPSSFGGYLKWPRWMHTGFSQLRVSKLWWGFLGGSVAKNLPASVGSAGDVDWIPRWRRSPKGGHGNPLLYSCWDHPMDREAWRATVHGVTKNQTWLKWLNKHSNLGNAGLS